MNNTITRAEASVNAALNNGKPKTIMNRVRTVRNKIKTGLGTLKSKFTGGTSVKELLQKLKNARCAGCCGTPGSNNAKSGESRYNAILSQLQTKLTGFRNAAVNLTKKAAKGIGYAAAAVPVAAGLAASYAASKGMAGLKTARNVTAKGARALYEKLRLQGLSQNEAKKMMGNLSNANLLKKQELERAAEGKSTLYNRFSQSVKRKAAAATMKAKTATSAALGALGKLKTALSGRSANATRKIKTSINTLGSKIGTLRAAAKSGAAGISAKAAKTAQSLSNTFNKLKKEAYWTVRHAQWAAKKALRGSNNNNLVSLNQVRKKAATLKAIKNKQTILNQRAAILKQKLDAQKNLLSKVPTAEPKTIKLGTMPKIIIGATPY